MRPCFILFLFLSLATARLASPSDQAVPAPGTHAHYLVLTATPHRPPPFAAVDLVYGPRERVGATTCVWWQLEARTSDTGRVPPLFALRALTSRDPLAAGDAPLRFERYLLRIPETGETLEYRDLHSGRPLLPPWRDFTRGFIPSRAKGTAAQGGVAETGEYLGHVLTLKYVGQGVAWDPWSEAKVLTLDRELLVGTGRPFKDQEGHRLPQTPQRQNYTYIPFTSDDYRVMIEAGINLFTVKPEQEQWVRAEPVFYLRGAAGTPHLRYPADLYRSNYLGPVMFLDEPAIILVGDPNIHNTLRYFSDAAALLEKRVRTVYSTPGSYSAFRLQRELETGANLGALRIEQCDYPAWETLYETAYYQLRAGLAGIVHEGRYQLAPFDKAVARWSGTARRHTAGEMFQYHYAFLRGAARAFGKSWGTSIYGQCDPRLAAEAVTRAYDMGARYVWFWTSDHDHHVPWPEQLELARRLRRHAWANPRPSLFGPAPTLDTAIVIPYGYFLSLENLWWVRALDKEGKNEASRNYRRLMERALKAVHDAMDRGESFDITVDDGRPIQGYRRVVRISDRE